MSHLSMRQAKKRDGAYSEEGFWVELVESLKGLQIGDTFVRLQALMHVPTRSWFDRQGSFDMRNHCVGFIGLHCSCFVRPQVTPGFQGGSPERASCVQCYRKCLRSASKLAKAKSHRLRLDS